MQQLVVIRTGRGQAQALAERSTARGSPEAVGTIAGDDTILVIARGARARRGAGQAARRTTPAELTRIVLAYSGSLETLGRDSRGWRQRYAAEIIAVTHRPRAGKDVLEEIRDRALATGALRAHVLDVRDDVRARLHRPRARGRACLRDAVADGGGARRVR